jgi:phenylpropionate dioxygenase-like ring-hydroxylating dioxygenase large terminal subunit
VSGGEPDAEPGRELGTRAYVDPAVHAAELERVFRRTWLPVARSAELDRPGAFCALEVAGAPLALVRDEDGALRAFHNACRHRGAQILRAERGCVRELRCPYHGFTYDLDGRFRGAPEAAEVLEAERDSLHLAPVAARERDGWAWIHLGPDPEPLERFLGPLGRELERWPLASLEVLERRTLDVDFGWKIGVEAFLEPLHVPSIHGRSAHPVVDVRNTRFFELGEHSGMAIPFRAPGVWGPDGPLGSAALAADVAPFPGLDLEQRTHHVVYLVFPATILMLFPNHLMTVAFLPLAVGRARLDFALLAAPAASGRAAAWYESLKPGYAKLLEEDLENLPWIQRGVAGGSLAAIAPGGLEERIPWFRHALARRLAP